MRKTLAVLAIPALLLPAMANAQLMLKGGLSFASASNSQYLPDVDTKTGFSAGLSFGLPLGEGLQLRPELLYVQKGGKLATNADFELNELNIPVLLQVNLLGAGIAPYLFGGPQAEYELTCTRADVDCVNTTTLRWGAVAGAGIRLGSSLSVEGRYNWTLTEIGDNIGSKPRAILLMVGFALGGGM